MSAPEVNTPTPAAPGGLLSWLWALLRQRCPNCRKGRMFRSLFDMNDPCPECGTLFQREEGYFLEKSGLLAKIEREGTEAGLRVDKAYLYSAYKEFDGVKLPTKEIVLINNRKFTEFTSSDVSFPARLDAKTFGKP